MQMMHSLSHCLVHSVDGYRDDSNIGETPDGKLLARLGGVYVQSVYFLCVYVYACMLVSLREREKEHKLAFGQMPVVYVCMYHNFDKHIFI